MSKLTQNEQERARFEAWFKRECGEGMFALAAKNAAWKAWQARCPEGYSVVPDEPTGDMIEEARDCHEGNHYLPYSLYRAMLAAAPQPGEES